MASITTQMLEERLGLLKQELQQLLRAQVIYEGAIQDCQHWLDEARKEEPQSNE